MISSYSWIELFQYPLLKLLKGETIFAFMASCSVGSYSVDLGFWGSH
jgi:hypothetical protein